MILLYCVRVDVQLAVLCESHFSEPSYIVTAFSAAMTFSFACALFSKNFDCLS